MATVVATIIAGGQGTRFWPVSRQALPKQFLPLGPGGETLIELTAKRVAQLVNDQIHVVTGDQHQALVRRYLPKAVVLSEPVPRNTAAAIGLGALHARRLDPEAVMIVLPADHFVHNEEQLQVALRTAIDLALQKQMLVTLGITPTSPHTGYGYIERGDSIGRSSFEVLRFVEKPPLEIAEGFVQSGQFCWNSGMFVWRAADLLAAISKFMPELGAGLGRIDAAIGTPSELSTIAEVFAKLEPVSIDFGVMEHSDNRAMVETGEIGWSDIGSWDAWACECQADAQGNVVSGDSCLIDTRNSIVHSEGQFVALLGVEGLVVIATKDAILVGQKSRAQEVKRVVDSIKASGRKELL